MARGFLLHSRPYRETSLIATFVTDIHGRIDLLVRSARGGRNKKIQPVLPFCLYELSWVGRGELKHLQFFETLESAAELSGTNLFCGFYLNELLYRLLPQHEAEHRLLPAYSFALQQLQCVDDVEPVLRAFELTLLDALGYGLDFLKDHAGTDVVPMNRYLFVPEVGLRKVTMDQQAMRGAIIGTGDSFMAIGQRDFARAEVRQLAKSVLRTALSVCLGGKPLRSRELFS